MHLLHKLPHRIIMASLDEVLELEFTILKVVEKEDQPVTSASEQACRFDV